MQQCASANRALTAATYLGASESDWLVGVLAGRDVPEQVLLLLPAHLLYDFRMRQRWLEIVVELVILLRRLPIQGSHKFCNSCSLPI